MILSASRRTDIPSWYAEWFLNRIRAGEALVRNPMNPAQLSKILLSPESVDCIIFWTKDAARMLPYLDELDERGYPYYFQFTLTPYGRELEPGLRPKAELVQTFLELSERIGQERIVWRYDPIVLNDDWTITKHKIQFRRLCEQLSGATDTVTISFVDLYRKLKMTEIRAILAGERAELAEALGGIAREFGLRPVACCEQDDLTRFGIERAACIDKARIERICGCPMNLKPDRNQRTGCGCMESVDIGAYNNCLNGCVYCYANDSFEAARRRYEAHNPKGALLTGDVRAGETVKIRKAQSNRCEQINLF